MPAADATAIERVFREEYGRAVAVMVRVFGDIDIAEESVQEAFTGTGRSTGSAVRPPATTGTPRPTCCTRKTSPPRRRP